MQTDINCDMGEGMGNEPLLLPWISSANIACGYHAGSETEMKRVVEDCLQYNVAIGAHPSFPDRENFGRRTMHLPMHQITGIITDQLSALDKIVFHAGGQLHHVKPHGALYNMAAVDEQLAGTIAAAIRDFDSRLVVYGLSGSAMITEATKAGLSTAAEVFADRTYQPGGTLTPRSWPNALLEDAGQVLSQVLKMICASKVTTVNGIDISIQADTICVHGDGIHAVEFAELVYKRLVAAGVDIKPTRL